MTEERDNTVYIGDKPFGKYVGSVLTQFGDFDEVNVVARGRLITKAVDVAEVVKRKHDPVIDDIETESEERTGEDGDTYNISRIRIRMTS